MAQRRLLIVEEALKNLKAHWYEYIKTISEEFLKEGWEVDVACHEDPDEMILDTFSAHAIFKSSRYLGDFVYQWPLERYYSFITHSIGILSVMWSFLKQREKYRHIFVPTVLHHHLMAWWFIMNFHPKRPDHLTLFFVTNPGAWNEQKKMAVLPRTAKFIGLLIRFFKKLEKKGRVTLAVETRGAQKEFADISGIPFKLYPHPVNLQAGGEPDNSESNKIVRFACLGFARYEKGSDILKEALEKLIDTREDDWKFTVQWTDSFRLPDGQECTTGELLTISPQVEIIDRPLDSKEYWDLLQEVDCMVLPYRNSSYYARLSRILIECLCLGIPVIYTKGGWMEEQVDKYGFGMGYEDGSAINLLNAIKKMKAQESINMNKNSSKVLAARNYYSARNFLKLFTWEDDSRINDNII